MKLVVLIVSCCALAGLAACGEVASSSDPACGDGTVDADEVCDDGNTAGGDGCSSDCQSDETCGNEVIDVAAGETCDDGNTTDGDGCEGDCRLPVCSPGLTECSGECVDTDVDPGNCGGCDVGGSHTCPVGIVCVEGECDVELYDFTSHTFTNCGQIGPAGPAEAQCETAYGTPWASDDAYFTVVNGIQTWVVPKTGSYTIRAAGAAFDAGAPQQRGAVVTGTFTLGKGDVVRILVGQMATVISSGSGGTFVDHEDLGLLVAAGGAGGICSTTQTFPQTRASDTTAGVAGNTGAGGLDGNGGQSGCATSPYGGGGGGGYLTDGVDNDTTYGCPGLSFASGGGGGTNVCGDTNSGDGGFGGGGAGFTNCEPAGGGGYSGGGGGGANNICAGSADRVGGGGGSFNSGTNPTVTLDHAGHGYVLITAN